MMTFDSTRRRLLTAAVCLAALAAGPARADLDKIKKTGTLTVAVYEDFAPYSDKSGGIDVDIGAALAAKLGVKMSPLPFPAGETLNDDLRNMVWKGHYLGYGPADVMLHVPIDRALAKENPQVEIFAPYHTETVRLVHNVDKVPNYRGLSSMLGKDIGVEKVSIAAVVLLGEDNGAYRDHVKIYDNGIQAVQALKEGKLDGVLANRSEIETVLRGDPRFEMDEVSFARLPPKGWTVGLAVKKENRDLAHALQDAMDELFKSGEMAKIFAKYGVQVVRP
ncbi:MAG: substrate-binding periplasmic protein [Burkholderiaceae bacterium]